MYWLSDLFFYIYFMEIWKEVKGYEGLYEVSNIGNVKSLPRNTTLGGILKTSITRGYVSCGVWKDGKGKMVKVHRLVADAFIENIKNLPQVNHIDGNRLNNFFENLEWVTPRENTTHREISKSNKKSKYAGVSYSEYKGKKYWIAFCSHNSILKHLGSFKSEEEARQKYLEFVKDNNIVNKYA
jgi:hypothetical protein